MEVDAPLPSPVCNYVVTAHKPTAVVKSLVGNFTGPGDLNLIVAKSTRLEIYKSGPGALEGLLDVPLYGRISALELFRPKGHKQDLLFVLLERYKFCVLQYNATTRELDTKAHGNVQDTVGRPCDAGQLALVDPLCRCIGLQLYDGMFKVIPMDEHGSMSEAFNTRLEELCVIDIAMISGCSQPTIVVLYEDTARVRHTKAYEVNIQKKDLIEVDAYIQRLDSSVHMLVPLPQPVGGVLLLGNEAIMHMDKERITHTCPISPCVLKAWGAIDTDYSRILLSDHQGLLYVLVLVHDGPKVLGLKLERVGRTSSASSLSYLDSGVVFVGSRQGDSQLIRLHATPPDPSQDNSFVQVLDTWPNLGPTVDFAVMDMDRQGQGQLVCCSGAMSDGSLRVVRNGVGINEQASIELEGIRGLWSLRPSWSSVHHKYLVLTMAGVTRVLSMNQDEEMDETELPGFEARLLSLWCGNMASDHLVQVTPAGVRAVACDSGMLEVEWQPQGGQQLSIASGNATQVVLAGATGQLHVVEVTSGGVALLASHNVGAEVACVDITPTGSDPLRAQYVAVGTWSMDVQLYALVAGGEAAAAAGCSHSLQLVTSQQLEGGVIPRSVLQWVFEGVPYLLVGLGDGHLHYWKIQHSSGELVDKKKLVLGSKPVILRPFKGGPGQPTPSSNSMEDATPAAAGAGTDVNSVLAGSDRPAVLYSNNKKVLFANLNENEVNYIAPFNCPSFPDSLAIAKEGSLTIGTVDEIQKLHIRTLPLHEQPRRIAYQEETHLLGVLTIMNMGMTDEQCFVRVFDAGGAMEVRAGLTLEQGEMGCAILSGKLGENPEVSATYFVVGTAIATPDEHEPSRGRILVLQYNPQSSELTLVAQREMKGAVYEVVLFQGGRLLCSCNSTLHLFNWVQKDDLSCELQPECHASGHVMALYLAARGHHVVMGDLMRSVSLYLYKDKKLELRAQDFNSNWCTAIAILDDDTYLAAENSYNLVVVRKNADGMTDEEASRLEVVGEYHLGEFVNRVRPGSLVVRLPDSQLAQVPTWLLGTIDGAIFVMASLPPPLYELLGQLQDAMRKVVKGVGGLLHSEWRSFANERKVVEARGFLDGDLIEAFLDLKPPDAQKVVSLMGGGVTVEDVVQKVEELQRLH